MHDHRSIQELAYLLWEARGRPHGSAEQDWLNAERQFAAHSTPTSAGAQPTAKSVDDALKDSFPASDPPAVHRPDEPPVNADQKWKAAGRTRTGASRPKAAKPAGASAAKPAGASPAAKSESPATDPASPAAKLASPAGNPSGAASAQPVAASKPSKRAAPKSETGAKPAGKKPPGSPASKSP